MRKILFLTLLYICIGWSVVVAQPKYEIRATWLTTLGGMDWPSTKATSPEGITRQQTELRQILDRLKEAQFNTVLLQVRTRGAMIYPSRYEPFDENIAGKNGRHPQYDPLQFAIEECHKRGMELHAWLVTMPVGNTRQVNALGAQSVVKRRPELCKQHDGAWYLNPGHPETAVYLKTLVDEIVKHYDVDGIHLDYIRYPENAGKFPDADTYRRYGNGKSKEQWRRDNITHIVREIYREVKQQKPWVKVSSAPIGKFADTPRYSSKGWNAFRTVHQDVKAWLAEGIHDMIFPMMYFEGNNFYPFALDWVENSNGRPIVPGLGIYFLHPQERNWSLDEIVRQVHFSRQSGGRGQAYFRNKFLLNNTKGLLDELKETVYAYPAAIPPMTWMNVPAPHAPAQLQATASDAALRLSWTAGTHPRHLPLAYRVYASHVLPVDIERAEHLVATGVRGCEYLVPAHHPLRNAPYWAVTATDRFGNESVAVHSAQPHGEVLFTSGVLPAIPRGGVLILSDCTGRELLRTSEPMLALPASVRGFITYTLLSADKRLLSVGVFYR